MPSSHALSLAYLSTYACAAVLSAHPPGTPGYSLAGAIPCCGACLSSLCNGLPCDCRRRRDAAAKHDQNIDV